MIDEKFSLSNENYSSVWILCVDMITHDHVIILG